MKIIKRQNNSYREQAESCRLGEGSKWGQAKGQSEEAQTAVHKTNKPQRYIEYNQYSIMIMD